MFEIVNQDVSNQGIKQNINNVVITGQGITSISKSDIVGKITLKHTSKNGKQQNCKYYKTKLFNSLCTC